MVVVWMIHVHSIKFTSRIVLGEPPPILSISSNFLLWFIDYPGFNIVNYLNMTIVGVLYFDVVEGMVYVTSSYLNISKDISFDFI